MTKLIFIVGHMGAGKFVFAEALAQKLGWQVVESEGFPDKDAEINKIIDEDVNKVMKSLR